MKYLSVILIIILSFNLVQVEAKHLKHLVDWGHYNSDSHPPWDQLQPDWMARLPAFRSVAHVSIPGTHDSGTFPAVGGEGAQCQSWNIYDQLRAGIRFLDIRFDYFYRWWSNDYVLGIYHGSNFQTELKPQLEFIKRFLKQHPNEFIIMLLAQQQGANRDGNVRNLLQSLFDQINFPQYNSPNIPIVGEVRGKVWIMLDGKSFPDLQDKYFMYYNKQTYWSNYTRYILQNQWQAREGQKVKYVKKLIELNSDCRQNVLKFNWLNKAWNGFYFPYWFAKYDGLTNEPVQSYLNQKKRPCMGILVMDFPGTNLIRLIINNNW